MRVLISKPRYLESVEFIYTRNIINVSSSPYSLQMIPSCVAPPMLAAIRVLEFDFCMDQLWIGNRPRETLPDNLQSWDRACAIIASFKGLRVLNVKLFHVPAELWSEMEQDLLRPMMKIRGLDSSTFTVIWRDVYGKVTRWDTTTSLFRVL